MLLIADFAPQTRPMIPALIIHCCNEIEKRGLEEEGLYRKSGSDREVNDLKDKILKSKSGIPDLAQYDVHVLCGVVKKFLRHLDEAIATRILWRDFVRAAGLSLKPIVSYFYFFFH
jgi:Rac GTPase-activating protein 1